MPKISLKPEARNDLTEIWLHVAEKNQEAADQLLDKIDRQCRILANHPESGRARQELATSLRSFHIAKYVIFYRPIQDGIEVVRVMHGARDLEQEFHSPGPSIDPD